MNATREAKLASLPRDTTACAIGNTPLVPIYLTINGIARKVHLKLESANPTGSIKYRTGYGLIQALETQGLLTKDSIVIESTSGNLGVALSALCKQKGYKFVAVVDPKTTAENMNKMLSWDAEIELVQQADKNGGYLLTRLERVKELSCASSRYIWTNQYANPANPAIHYLSTGPEIYQQMKGEVGTLFIAVSTGGTLAGIGRYFRETSPSTCVVGVDAHGSVIFGTPAAPRRLTGIGSSRPSTFLDATLYDTSMHVTDEDAFLACWTLAEATGISVGGSSGAVLAACAQYLAEHAEAVNVVCLCPDDGNNYAESIFNRQWIKDQQIDLSKAHPIQMQRVPDQAPENTKENAIPC